MGPSRLPLVSLSDKSYQQLYDDLKEISFFDKVTSKNKEAVNIFP
jgi:hypothetical protein